MAVERKVEQLSHLDMTIGNNQARHSLLNLFDAESFIELEAYRCCGVIIGYGTIEGKPVYAFSQVQEENYGAVSLAQAQKIKRLYDLAIQTGNPIVGIYNSYGAQIDEGLNVLNAYGEILACVNHASGVIPQVSVIAGSCIGAAAMVACSADIVILTKQGELSFEYSSAATNTTEDAMQSGGVHLIADDLSNAMLQTRKLLTLLPSNNLVNASTFTFEPPENNGFYKKNNENIIQNICDPGISIELQAEYGECISTILTSIGGRPVGVISTFYEKKTICAKDANKAARFIQFCDSFHLPIVSFIDTNDGNRESKGVDAIRYFSKMAHVLSEATTPKIAVIAGECYGSAFIAFASKSVGADLIIAWTDASISVLPLDTSVEFFWHDKLKGAVNTAQKREQLIDEYRRTNASSIAAAAGGFVDLVISPEQTRNTIVTALNMLLEKRVTNLPKKHGNMPL